MREVEIMAKLGSIEAFTTQLEQIGVQIDSELVQEDAIYVPFPLELSEVDAHRTPILRIRTENGTHKFTLKRNAEPGSDSLNNIEHELQISDDRVMHQILLELGQHVCLNVKKTRRLATYGEFQLCIDSVEELGDFVEVEVLSDDTVDVEAARERMWLFLESLDVSRTNRVQESYDRQIIRQRTHMSGAALQSEGGK